MKSDILGSEVVEAVIMGVFRAFLDGEDDQQEDRHVHLCWTCKKPWEHVRPIGVSSKEYAKKHMCPNCGAGPWFTRYTSMREAERRLASGPSYSDTISEGWGTKPTKKGWKTDGTVRHARS